MAKRRKGATKQSVSSTRRYASARATSPSGQIDYRGDLIYGTRTTSHARVSPLLQVYPDKQRSTNWLRRTQMQRAEAARMGVRTAKLPSQRRNGNASENQTRPYRCATKKSTRRAIILATGHGGRNNVRLYKKRKPC